MGRKGDLRAPSLKASNPVVASSPQNAPSATTATGTIPASNGSLSVPRRVGIDNHDRTTEAILSSLQSSGSQTFLNSSSSNGATVAAGSPSIYSVPERDDSLRN